jgi:hypothetical protein
VETYSGQRKATEMTPDEKLEAHARWESGKVDQAREARSALFVRATQKKGAPMTYGKVTRS